MKTLHVRVNTTSTSGNYTFSINELVDYVQLKYAHIKQTFIYAYKGPLTSDSNSTATQDYEEKATFDPEIFFDILLPPIIFHAGYSMKRVRSKIIF